MPQYRAPMDLADGARRGRVHGDHRAETDAEGTETSKADRAHGEVRVAREDLESDRCRRRGAIVSSQAIESFFRQGLEV